MKIKYKFWNEFDKTMSEVFTLEDICSGAHVLKEGDKPIQYIIHDIYEGDYIECFFEEDYDNDCVSVEAGTTHILEARFDYQGLFLEDPFEKTWYYYSDLVSNDIGMKVIGNKYQNPEIKLNLRKQYENNRR